MGVRYACDEFGTQQEHIENGPDHPVLYLSIPSITLCPLYDSRRHRFVILICNAHVYKACKLDHLNGSELRWRKGLEGCRNSGSQAKPTECLSFRLLANQSCLWHVFHISGVRLATQGRCCRRRARTTDLHAPRPVQKLLSKTWHSSSNG